MGLAAVQGGETAHGWRGNGTGLWTDSSAPITWQRLAKGAMEGLRARADKPAGADAGDAPLVEKGLIRPWLVIGPFPVGDAMKEFDLDALQGEASVQPSADGKWKAATVPADDPTIFGTAEMAWLDLIPSVGFQPNQLAYAHTYLHSPRGGAARIVANHGEGLKVWLNGEVVYRSPERRIGLSYYSHMGIIELAHEPRPSARFDLTLKPGWNRLLLKLSSPRPNSFQDMRCTMRLMDPPTVAYESKNIAWMTELPGRSTSTPIRVGDRLFVMAEPDELLCLEARTGKILWRASNSLYDAVPEADRRAKPGYAEQVDPLVARLKQEADAAERLKLRGQIAAALKKIDAERFTLKLNDHFEGHFGIVGFTMPTPVSDGKRVWVWCNLGVAACYDLEGRRQWIRRLPIGGYGASPALADGVLAVFAVELLGLDAATGETRWTQSKVKSCLAAVQATRFNDQPVFVTQRGDIVRPSDGEFIFRPRTSTSAGDTGWAPPVLLGQRMYHPNYGVSNIQVFDFAEDTASPETFTVSLGAEINRGPGGKWIDRWTAGSPVVWQDLAYQVDIYGQLYVVDLKTRKLVYRQPLELRGLMHYNAVSVAASVTLVGKHLLVFDNQGTCLALEPGREFKQIGVNRIETQLERYWPLPAQETLTYAPPLVDGDRLYIRGERYLYCVSEK
jgi:outer membrane protein assembly factor BamB